MTRPITSHDSARGRHNTDSPDPDAQTRAGAMCVVRTHRPENCSALQHSLAVPRGKFTFMFSAGWLLAQFVRGSEGKRPTRVTRTLLPIPHASASHSQVIGSPEVTDKRACLIKCHDCRTRRGRANGNFQVAGVWMDEYLMPYHWGHEVN